MKSSIITANILGLVTAFSITVQPLYAQQVALQPPSQPPAPAITDSIAQPLNWQDQNGSTQLQEDVLMKINQAVREGTLSAEDAAELKIRLNKVNDRESWYKTENSAIPNEVTETNKVILHDMSKKIAVAPHLSPAAENALHADIDELISKALQHNRISSMQAEQYYMRLAQIESNLQSARGTAAADQQLASVGADLNTLKSELTRKQ